MIIPILHLSGVKQMHPNPGSYDDCAERALVNRLLEVFNCSVITPKVPKKYHKTSGAQSTPVPKITSKETFTKKHSGALHLCRPRLAYM